MGKTSKPLKTKTGPKALSVKIRGNWESAVGKALKKERPKEGWPNIEKKKPAISRASSSQL